MRVEAAVEVRSMGATPGESVVNKVVVKMGVANNDRDQPDQRRSGLPRSRANGIDQTILGRDAESVRDLTTRTNQPRRTAGTPWSVIGPEALRRRV
jgi:hypothetical protein